MTRATWMAFGIAVGLFVFQTFGAGEVITWPEVIVPARELEAREPPARPPTIVERIVYRNVQPIQLARAPEGGRNAIASFCRPVVVSLTDTVEVEVADPQLLLRSGVFSSSWWGKDRFRLTGPTNAGELLEYSYRTRGSFDFRADGDSVLVRYARINAVRDGWELGSQVWALFSIGKALLEVAR